MSGLISFEVPFNMKDMPVLDEITFTIHACDTGKRVNENKKRAILNTLRVLQLLCIYPP